MRFCPLMVRSLPEIGNIHGDINQVDRLSLLYAVAVPRAKYVVFELISMLLDLFFFPLYRQEKTQDEKVGGWESSYTLEVMETNLAYLSQNLLG